MLPGGIGDCNGSGRLIHENSGATDGEEKLYVCGDYCFWPDDAASGAVIRGAKPVYGRDCSLAGFFGVFLGEQK